jgi:hypothetical protein
MSRILVLAAALLVAPTLLAAPAARVEFAIGDVVATDTQGKLRLLTKGAQIAQGDTVSTNDGRAQLRFSDGAYVSLQPASQFRVDDYRFEGKADGSERGFFSLLSGGMRTITGLVGRTNKRNYQVSTAVATIGIRGTEYTLSYGGSVSGSVGEGEIVVCNGAGCINVTNGESYYVPDAQTRAVLTGKKSDLPPPQREAPPPQLTQGDECLAATCAPTAPFVGEQKLALAHAVNLGGGGVARMITSGSGLIGLVPLDVVAFDAGGYLVSVNNGKDPLTPLPALGSGYRPPAFGNDGLIAWGVALDQSGQYFHYATGLPAVYGDLATLRLSQPVATLNLIGASPPIALSTAGEQIGRITGGKLEARFVENTVNVRLDMEILGSSLSASGNALRIGSGAATDTITFGGSDVSCTGATCGGEMTGFIGADALRAGLAYKLYVDTGREAPTVVGTAAFAR